MRSRLIVLLYEGPGTCFHMLGCLMRGNAALAEGRWCSQVQSQGMVSDFRRREIEYHRQDQNISFRIIL